MSSHRCYSKSNQISSGFVITNASSQVSVRGAIFMPATFNIRQSCKVIKYHFPGPFILATSDMVEEVYVTAEAGAKASKEAIEMWTEVALEPSARKAGHQSANKRTVATGIPESSSRRLIFSSPTLSTSPA
ncbi:hypothetical protein IGI04_007584 [Brassica rapa subsp. trilocularis]|uniref:Uncharacterized protein n=1 Tax=Brassica rapa subsp. trilocularis TaxID=1813537 RepID=A0ABQ7NMF6_BRACM|nr:hypothetical protein IGI04_007584 [Brassica rapa subsp. trilocularis]